MTQATKPRSKPPSKNEVKNFGINMTKVANDDIKAGLPVIIYARWILVIAGFVLTLWNTNNLVEVQISVLILLGLAVGNFFLQVEVNRKRAIPAWIVYGASLIDIAAIAGVLALSNSFPSSTYVFFMPALLAISVTFSTSNTTKYTVGALIAYALLAIAPINDAGGSSEVASSLIIHALVLVAVPFCGNVYWRLERTRRVQELHTDLAEQALTDNFELSSTEVTRDN
jgi:hypothetical protein